MDYQMHKNGRLVFALCIGLSALALSEDGLAKKRAMVPEARALYRNLKPSVTLIKDKFRPNSTRVVVSGAAAAYADRLYGISKNPAYRVSAFWNTVTRTIIVPDKIAHALAKAAKGGNIRLHTHHRGFYGGKFTDIRLVAGSGRNAVVLDSIGTKAKNGQIEGTRVQYGMGKTARSFRVTYTQSKRWLEKPAPATTTALTRGLSERSNTGGRVNDSGIWLTNVTLTMKDQRRTRK